MTSETAEVKDEDFVVHVKAQVMTRDDSKGGWVPLGGGGMSVIGLCRLMTVGRDKNNIEFLIYGHRIADKSVVLKCMLKKDLQYTHANPTFHHWRTEGGRFGLTFQSATDARVFEKGVRKAVDSLRQGPLERTVRALKGEDQDIFMSLNLPLERKDSISRPESTASTTVSTPSAQSPTSPTAPPPHTFLEPSNTTMQSTSCHQSHASGVETNSKAVNEMTTTLSKRLAAWYFTFPPISTKNASFQCVNTCTSLPDPVLLHKNKLNRDLKAPNRSTGDGAKPGEEKEAGNNAYVEFAKKTIEFEYSYPQLECDSKTTSARSPVQPPTVVSTVVPTSGVVVHSMPVVSHPKSCRRDAAAAAEDQPTRRLLSQRLKCVHCQETFIAEENRRGSCVDAPDPALDCIEGLSCSCCARAVLYHCMTNAETNDDPPTTHPCSCNVGDKNNWRRWTVLSFLSVVIPCLWCYWPLIICHRCAVRCGCCGARHEAAAAPP